MSTKKLSEIYSSNPADAFNGAEIIEVTQGGVTKGGTIQQVADFIVVALNEVVAGPASATDSHFAQFDGATGKVLKDGGLSLDIDGSMAANSDSKVPSQKAVKTAIAQAIADLVSSSPTTLDTLNELAAALGNDANFAATMTTALGLKAPLNSPGLTGTPTAPTATAGTSTTQIATTAFVQAAVSAAGGGTVVSVDITPPPAGITASGGPITSFGSITLALANDLAGLEALSGTGVPIRTATDTWSQLEVDTDTNLTANSDSRLATQKAVKAYADALVGANDAMVYKGVIDCSSNPNYPAANQGDTYRVSVAGKIGGASGVNVEVADILMCLTDGTPAGTQASVGANWTIIQANIDGAVIGPASATDNRVAVFDGSTGKLIKDSGLTLSGSNTGDQTITLTGDVTGSGTGSFAATVANDAISNAKLANMANATIKGRTTAGTGDPEDLTAAQAAAILGQNVRPKETIYIACSDETTALTAGTAKVTFRMPYAFTLTEVRASLTTAQTSGNIFTINVKEAGTTIFSTKPTIDNTEKSTTTAATAAVISDTSLADDAEITVDIDQIGDGTAKGLKVMLIGYRA
jgi:hypothetical protein